MVFDKAYPFDSNWRSLVSRRNGQGSRDPAEPQHRQGDTKGVVPPEALTSDPATAYRAHPNRGAAESN